MLLPVLFSSCLKIILHRPARPNWAVQQKSLKSFLFGDESNFSLRVFLRFEPEASCSSGGNRFPSTPVMLSSNKNDAVPTGRQVSRFWHPSPGLKDVPQHKRCIDSNDGPIRLCPASGSSGRFGRICRNSSVAPACCRYPFHHSQDEEWDECPWP